MYEGSRKRRRSPPPLGEQFSTFVFSSILCISVLKCISLANKLPYMACSCFVTARCLSESKKVLMFWSLAVHLRSAGIYCMVTVEKGVVAWHCDFRTFVCRNIF